MKTVESYFLVISLLRIKVFQIKLTENHDNLRETSRLPHERTGWRMCVQDPKNILPERRGTWQISKKDHLENVVNQPEKIMNKIIFSNEDSMDLAYHCLKLLLLFKVINMEHYKMFKFRPSRIGTIRTRKFWNPTRGIFHPVAAL